MIKLAHTTSCALLLVLVLASCSSPPRPSMVDDSTKRPLNAKASVELQSCRSDLSRSTVLLDELARSNAACTAIIQSRVADRGGPAVDSAKDEATILQDRAGGNQIAIIEFAIGSASWMIEKSGEDALVRRASSSALVMIRGRTDAIGDSAYETALARRRAEAVAEFLRSRGVPPDRLRVTWQGAGDPRSRGAWERALNRRVELEFYVALPVTTTVNGDGRGNSF